MSMHMFLENVKIFFNFWDKRIKVRILFKSGNSLTTWLRSLNVKENVNNELVNINWHTWLEQPFVYLDVNQIENIQVISQIGWIEAKD